ncbi:hypothetical protein HAZT_HAZT005184 [Hyalella azteca]|uniref:LIM zinc-binding domain-containing protein n=1 Tax=Hyalella azteca TaxID=294128 RepID=A0A6A0GXE6_HYAAZ|nr:hypothetical protein HAZT_HAZT005184 [Hyalella azteca]
MEWQTVGVVAGSELFSDDAHEGILSSRSSKGATTKTAAMPFKPAAQIKCPRCAKSVYAAEARKMLDSTNLNCHETVLYCKTCHGRKFGPKGYGFGGGAAGLSMDTGAHLE